MGLGTERVKTRFCLNAGVVLEPGTKESLSPFGQSCSF